MKQFLEEFLHVFAIGLLAEASHSKYYQMIEWMISINTIKLYLYCSMDEYQFFRYNQKRNNHNILNSSTPTGQFISNRMSQKKKEPPKTTISIPEGYFSSPNIRKLGNQKSQKGGKQANIKKDQSTANIQANNTGKPKGNIHMYNSSTDKILKIKSQKILKQKKEQHIEKQLKDHIKPIQQPSEEPHRNQTLNPENLLAQAKKLIIQMKKCRHLANIDDSIRNFDKFTKEIERDKFYCQTFIIPFFQMFQKCFDRLSQIRINADAEDSQSSQEQNTDQRLFLSNILYNYKDYREYLHQVLKNHFGPIKKTNLLYRFDQHNKANIHKYIDRKKHLLFVIETTKNYMLAAYTEAPFEPQSTVVGRAIIFSLTNRRFYIPKRDKKAITYDQMYVIFGNSDLRIHESELLVNLGLNTCNYQSRGQRAHSLLGENNNTMTTINALQVFEVIYE